MCGLAVVSRAGYYRFCKPAPEADDEEESKLRDAIQRTAIESRQYGYVESPVHYESKAGRSIVSGSPV
jgi:hypothetical protein